MTAIHNMTVGEIRQALHDERRKVTTRLIDLRREVTDFNQQIRDHNEEIAALESRLRMIDHSEGSL